MKTSKMDKLNLLDKCIDGKADNLNELLDTAFEHFDIFYKICKEQVGENNISNVLYKGMTESRARFDIICIDKSTDSSLLVTDGKVMSDCITVERTSSGISLNISLREE